MSLGEDRVRVTSANDLADQIKQKSAELIDLCDRHGGHHDGEEGRLWALAMTHYEDAAMWAVKAATSPK